MFGASEILIREARCEKVLILDPFELVFGHLIGFPKYSIGTREFLQKIDFFLKTVVFVREIWGAGIFVKNPDFFLDKLQNERF